jgi:hypothetical protein
VLEGIPNESEGIERGDLLSRHVATPTFCSSAIAPMTQREAAWGLEEKRYSRVSVFTNIVSKLSEAALKRGLAGVPNEAKGIKCGNPLGAELAAIAQCATSTAPAREPMTAGGRIALTYAGVAVLANVGGKQAKPELPGRCRLLDQSDPEGRREGRSHVVWQIEVNLWGYLH